jgi:hypothetical protein
MSDKFTVEDLMIKIMPGGFFIAVVYFLFIDKISLTLVDNLDFLYTFLFFCSAFILGEILQTIAHLNEWIVDLFFKRRRPSNIFLYKNNPVLKSKEKRLELIDTLSLSSEDVIGFDKDYKELSFWKKKSDKKYDDISQSIFWKLYSNISDGEEIKSSNRNYLFVRGITIELIIISIILLVCKNYYFFTGTLVVSIIFLWRARGLARGLVFKTVLLNLKNK